MMGLDLPQALALRLAQEAGAAAPRECCGLVIGLREGRVARVRALYPARNLAGAPDRFEIDPADHFAANRHARAAGLAVIGCYHSHPGGQALPSQADRAGAMEEGFVWLIAAPDGDGWALGAFVYAGGGFAPCTRL